MICLVEKRGEFGRRKRERQEIEFWVMKTVMCMVFVRRVQSTLLKKSDLRGASGRRDGYTGKRIIGAMGNESEERLV